MTSDVVRFVDVREPLLNVWDEPMNPPKIGDVIDFGAAKENSMHGAWRVLSLERVGYSWQGHPASHLRANVERVR